MIFFCIFAENLLVLSIVVVLFDAASRFVRRFFYSKTSKFDPQTKNRSE